MFKYPGIIPPLKNMVNIINTSMGFLKKTFLDAKKYPQNKVMIILRGSDTTRINIIFLYPVAISGWVKASLYAPTLKPLGYHMAPG